jgi:uncharacterized paraquat-inducible protein A
LHGLQSCALLLNQTSQRRSSTQTPRPSVLAVSYADDRGLLQRQQAQQEQEQEQQEQEQLLASQTRCRVTQPPTVNKSPCAQVLYRLHRNHHRLLRALWTC